MPPDATDTKRRILAAAHEEFARFGLAGARIDRIADAAQANKRSIYAHFGSKNQLFDLVVVDALTVMAAAVPFTADDLPGYGGRLFDYLVTEPATLRLTVWANLERPEATSAESDAYGAKVDQLRGRFGDRAIDVLALLLGLVTAWPNASSALTSPGGSESPIRLAAHRALLVSSIAAMTTVLADDRVNSEEQAHRLRPLPPG